MTAITTPPANPTDTSSPDLSEIQKYWSAIRAFL